MTPEEERFDLLAKAAWERFRDRRSYEWKIFFGVWTAFGSAAGFVLSSEQDLYGSDLLILAGLTILILYGILGRWLPWIQKSNERDQATSYYWFSAIENSMGDHLPGSLWPEQPWLRYRARRPDPSCEITSKPQRRGSLWATLGPAAQGHVLITLAFALLLLYGVWTRWHRPNDVMTSIEVASMGLGTWLQALTGFKEIMVAGAAIFAAWVAYRGVDAWRRQLRGSTEYQVALKVLRDVIAVRDAINAARYPIRFPEEAFDRPRETGEPTHIVPSSLLGRSNPRVLARSDPSVD